MGECCHEAPYANLYALPGEPLRAREPRRGYTMRWLRLKPRITQLMRQMESLSSNRTLRILLQSENTHLIFQDDTMTIVS